MKILVILSLLFFSCQSTLSAAPKEMYQQVKESRKNAKNWPPLAYAVHMGWHDAVKFLLDRDEDVLAATPSRVVWYEDVWSGNSYPLTYQEPGLTPLELAIVKQDPEMIGILTTYHPTNFAKVEFTRVSYSDLYTTTRLYSSHGCKKESTPLSDALNTNNDAVIDKVIRAYKDSVWLFNDYKKIAALRNPKIIQSFLEHNYLLWTGCTFNVDEEIIELFLEKNLLAAIQANNFAHVEQFLTYGWIISKEEFEAALDINNADVIHMLVNHKKFQIDLNPFELILEKNKEIAASIPFSAAFLKAIAKCNQVPLFEKFIDQANANLLQECYILAAEQGSLGIVEILIANGVCIDGALLSAARNHQLEMVQYFLEHKLHKSEIEDALKLAYEQHDYEIIDALLMGLN